MKNHLLKLLITLAVMSASVCAAEQKPAEVYFSKDISPAAVVKIYDKLNFKPEQKLGIKIHFGEDGNKNFIPPALVKDLVLKLKGTFVETNTLYGGPRSSPKSHIKLAKKHGWGYAPIDILDENGETEIPYKGKFFTKVYVGKNMSNYKSFLVISHFKGHGGAGFGGAIKNLAMGFGSPSGKRAQHSGLVPTNNPKKCTKCGLCRKECPVGAINPDFSIDRKKCIGCGKCVGLCPFNAIDSAVASTKGDNFDEKIAEYAKGVSQKGKFTYINLLINISRACDCSSSAPAPFLPDIGILASNDPVALDQASYDLITKAAGKPGAFEKEVGVSGVHTLEYAEKINLGTRKYKLISIGKEAK